MYSAGLCVGFGVNILSSSPSSALTTKTSCRCSQPGGWWDVSIFLLLLTVRAECVEGRSEVSSPSAGEGFDSQELESGDSTGWGGWGGAGGLCQSVSLSNCRTQTNIGDESRISPIPVAPVSSLNMSVETFTRVANVPTVASD